MKSFWLLFLTFSFASANGTTPGLSQCETSVGAACSAHFCFAEFVHHPEGILEVYGCEGNISGLPPDLCWRFINRTGSDATCLNYGKNKLCCCKSNSAELCNQQFKPSEKYITVSAEHLQNLGITFLIMATLAALVAKIGSHYDSKNRRVGISYNEDVNRYHNILFFAKILLMSVMLTVFWVPFSPDCSKHPLGKFHEAQKFVFEVVSPNIFVIFYFTLPVGLIFLDSVAFVTFRKNRHFHKTSRFIIYSGTFFVTISITINAFYEFYILNRKDKSKDYCNTDIAILKAAASFCLFIFYLCLIILHTYVLLRYPTVEIEEIIPNSEITEPNMTSTATSISSSYVEYKEEEVLFAPRPFHIDENGLGVVTITNTHRKDWVALRALLSSPPGVYQLHPSKFLIPPQRTVSMEVRYQPLEPLKDRPQSNLVFQWYILGSNAPTMNLNRMWSKPYVRSPALWKFFALPIFHEEPCSEKSNSDDGNITYS
ncbi:unnamed protein product [Caenorhabditis auriculariae]|uniref:Major sperm protein n=1 Tax=Caenorhabditis auriculariae TaxID=2777116 RepID=A0A8S1HBF5_9PELO|nr:unnamed protein product [Caenorhabditis auriculariae]